MDDLLEMAEALGHEHWRAANDDELEAIEAALLGHDDGLPMAPEQRSLDAALAEREAELDAARERELALVARLREALAATDPALTPSLISGATLEEIEASYAAALAAVARARAAMRAPSVGAGAPGRLAPPRTPFEKIRDGLSSG
jgi:hypothetical protein